MRAESGFTIVELAVTIVIMGILASIVIYIPIQFLSDARNQERTDDSKSIARYLEESYTSQIVGTPTYPSSSRLISDISSLSGTVARSQPEIFRAPGVDSVSVIGATSTSSTTPISGGVTTDTYVYQPLTTTNALCTISSACVYFNLYYKLEGNTTVHRIRSIHQQ